MRAARCQRRRPASKSSLQVQASTPGQAAFVPHSYALAVKLGPKRVGSKPVNASGESTIACEAAFWFVVQIPHCRRCPRNLANVAGAIALHCCAGTSGLQPLIPLGNLSLEAAVENRPVPIRRARHPFARPEIQDLAGRLNEPRHP
jgi:hypothetical protein